MIEELNNELNKTRGSKKYNPKNYYKFELKTAQKLTENTHLTFEARPRDPKCNAPDIICVEKPELVIECKYRTTRFPTRYQITKMYKEAREKYGDGTMFALRYENRDYFYIWYSRDGVEGPVEVGLDIFCKILQKGVRL